MKRRVLESALWKCFRNFILLCILLCIVLAPIYTTNIYVCIYVQSNTCWACSKIQALILRLKA